MSDRPRPESIEEARVLWSAECVHDKARAINCTECLAIALDAARKIQDDIWIDRANRYFVGVRNPRTMLKGWAKGTEIADVVMHEVWKRDTNVQALQLGLDDAKEAVRRIRDNWPHIQVVQGGHVADPGAPACLRCKLEGLIAE